MADASPEDIQKGMESAKALLDGHPHLEMAEGCQIEVHEALPLAM